MPTFPLTPQDLRDWLGAFRFNFASEDELQRGVERVLTACGASYEREYRIGARDRLDFLVAPEKRAEGERIAPGIAVEVKVGGTTADLIMQVHRYAQLEEVTGFVIVTSRTRHVLPPEIEGKPVVVLHVGLAW